MALQCGGASRPLGGREFPRYISLHLSLNSHFIQKNQKKRKRGEEERRGSGEALFTRRFGGIFSF
jgi:hypothetical protein